jgi:hypothetical protein
VVSRWRAGYTIDAIEAFDATFDPKHVSRYVSPPPLIEFHGSAKRAVQGRPGRPGSLPEGRQRA